MSSEEKIFISYSKVSGSKWDRIFNKGKRAHSLHRDKDKNKECFKNKERFSIDEKCMEEYGYGIENGKIAENLMKEYNKHVNAFAAAYLKMTNLPPDQVIMVVERTTAETGRLVERIWFEKKNGNRG